MEENLYYINQGRGGYVVYKDGKNDINFFFEYGGNNCVAIIYIPTTNEWTDKTTRALTERQSILTFIAEQTIRDQAPNSYYKISDNCIEIFV